MNYTRLTEKKKVEIDILLKQGMSMREVGRILKISHSTISRYKAKKYKERKQKIKPQYEKFLKYLYEHYNWKNNSKKIYSKGIITKIKTTNIFRRYSI